MLLACPQNRDEGFFNYGGRRAEIPENPLDAMGVWIASVRVSTLNKRQESFIKLSQADGHVDRVRVSSANQPLEVGDQVSPHPCNQNVTVQLPT